MVLLCLPVVIFAAFIFSIVYALSTDVWWGKFLFVIPLLTIAYFIGGDILDDKK
jgi:hypothetical protein